ncbi:MAG: hypothetical protein AAFR49_03805 [Pseudomonadota bacterium]
MPVSLKWTITLLMAATVFRAQTILFLPEVAAFGGPAHNAWFGPWFSDAIIGFLVPVMIFVLWKGISPRAWGTLIIYNSLGAFDYSQGLITQYFHPMHAEMASAMTVYLGIGVFMVFQITAIMLLFRKTVISQFFR